MKQDKWYWTGVVLWLGAMFWFILAPAHLNTLLVGAVLWLGGLGAYVMDTLDAVKRHRARIAARKASHDPAE